LTPANCGSVVWRENNIDLVIFIVGPWTRRMVMERSAEIIVARMNDRIAIHLLVGVESIERLGVELRIFFTVENNCKGMATRISLCLPLTATATVIVEVDNILFESLFQVYFE
jgi:hypothetical protein